MFSQEKLCIIPLLDHQTATSSQNKYNKMYYDSLYLNNMQGKKSNTYGRLLIVYPMKNETSD